MIESKVVILKTFKSEKKDKTQIVYGIPSEMNNSRGVDVFEEWIPNAKIYDEISDKDLLVPLLAQFSFSMAFGQAKPKLVSLVPSNGVDILAK